MFFMTLLLMTMLLNPPRPKTRSPMQISKNRPTMWASVGTLDSNSSLVSNLPGVTFMVEGCSGNNQSCRTVHLMEDDVELLLLKAEAWPVAFLVEVLVELV
jgi:hypothetical protein